MGWLYIVERVRVRGRFIIGATYLVVAVVVAVAYRHLLAAVASEVGVGLLAHRTDDVLRRGYRIGYLLGRGPVPQQRAQKRQRVVAGIAAVVVGEGLQTLVDLLQRRYASRFEIVEKLIGRAPRDVLSRSIDPLVGAGVVRTRNGVVEHASYRGGYGAVVELYAAGEHRRLDRGAVVAVYVGLGVAVAQRVEAVDAAHHHARKKGVELVEVYPVAAERATVSLHHLSMSRTVP